MRGTAYTIHAHGVRQQAARGGRVRRFPAIFGKCLMSFMLVCLLICQPYTIAVDGCQIKAQKQEAQAVPAAIPGAYAFLEAMAAAAGLSVPDFLMTFGIGLAATSGYSCLKEQVSYSYHDATRWLQALKDTGTWPAWDTLTSDEQSSWVTEDNYNAAKFNSMLTTIPSLADARERYYSGGTGGGSNFEFTTEESNLLNELGEMGKAWEAGYRVDLSRAIDKYTDIDSLFSANSMVNGVIYNNYGLAKYKVLEDLYVPYNVSSWSWILATNTSNQQRGYTLGANIDVKYCVNRREVLTNNFNIVQIMASEAPFNYQTYTDLNGNVAVPDGNYTRSATKVSNYKNSGNDFYYAVNYNGVTLIASSVTPLIREFSGAASYQEVAYVMVYGVEEFDSMPDYAETDNEPDYPSDKIGGTELGPNVDWSSLFGDGGDEPTPTPDPGYPESDFNPDVGDDDGDYVPETSTPEWQQKTQDQIFTPALNLPFDKMFPFCVIWDISKLMNKLYELGGYQAVSADQSTSLRSLYDKREGLQVQADGDLRGGTSISSGDKPAWTVGHTEIYVPLYGFHVDGMDEIELDIWPLAVLLAWLKPFFQLAFIAGLLFVTIVTFRMFIFSD